MVPSGLVATTVSKECLRKRFGIWVVTAGGICAQAPSIDLQLLHKSVRVKPSIIEQKPDVMGELMRHHGFRLEGPCREVASALGVSEAVFDSTQPCEEVNIKLEPAHSGR